ncbi:hypothetical protein B0O99DRAFT_655550 [Bisporella sp. PMI_857]|nr:hypothetical protein B0O99DRAFT_655550 [Bisporella sp. PMI_857]
MADASLVWKSVQPEGLALAILVITILFTIICSLVVGMRVWIRLKTKLFSLEDYLMCIGMALALAQYAVVMYGCYTGIGTRDAKMGVGTMMEGGKVVLFWQLFYVTSSTFIKASICATLIRVAVQRKYKYILWGLIALTTVANLVAFSAALARCKPIAAGWNPSLGKCLDQSIIITLTYVVSAVNIFTDWSVAIIPIFILWNVQMRRKLKIITGAILAVGILASAATIIRMPYSNAYSAKVNQLHDIGNIILWTVVECGLGIIAGSLPMLRTLFKSLAKDYSSNNGYGQYKRSDDTKLVTIGRLKGGHDRAHGGAENEVTLDSESTRNIITVTRAVEQTRAYNEEKEFGNAQRDSHAYNFGQDGASSMKR